MVIVLFSTPRVDEHVDDWLALAVLYAGPAIVGVAGLVRIFSAHPAMRSRPDPRCADYRAFVVPVFYVDTLVAVSANTAGG